ncbi:MAG: hypothetical protein RPU59_10460 [Candidatus Sedimenticola sp. (ex Thyasira tokunagai)]
MSNDHDKNALLSLQERYIDLFPVIEPNVTDQNEEFWLEQPIAQKVVDSFTTGSSSEPPPDSQTA